MNRESEIIGLTGGIACGKSTVAEMLRARGLAVLDADALSRELTAQGGAAIPALREAFAKYFDGEGRLDRGRLASLIFHDAAARKTLEGILHPLVIAGMEEETRALLHGGKGPIIWDVPLLYESGMDARCGINIVVSADRETQIARLRLRSGLSREDAIARIDSQMPLADKVARADFVIENNGGLDKLKEAVDRFIQTMIR